MKVYATLLAAPECRRSRDAIRAQVVEHILPTPVPDRVHAARLPVHPCGLTDDQRAAARIVATPAVRDPLDPGLRAEARLHVCHVNARHAVEPAPVRLQHGMLEDARQVEVRVHAHANAVALLDARTQPADHFELGHAPQVKRVDPGELPADEIEHDVRILARAERHAYAVGLRADDGEHLASAGDHPHGSPSSRVTQRQISQSISAPLPINVTAHCQLQSPMRGSRVNCAENPKNRKLIQRSQISVNLASRGPALQHKSERTRRDSACAALREFCAYAGHAHAQLHAHTSPPPPIGGGVHLCTPFGRSLVRTCALSLCRLRGTAETVLGGPVRVLAALHIDQRARGTQALHRSDQLPACESMRHVR